MADAEETLLEVVRLAAKEMPSPLFQFAYERWRREKHPTAPHAGSLAFHFGGWSGVLAAAGLPSSTYSWSEHELLDALTRFAAETPPPRGIVKYRAWRARSPSSEPSDGSICHRYGGWPAALARAGVQR